MVSSRTRPTGVILATRLFTPEVAAASFRLQALANGLVESGARVTVLTTRPPRSTSPDPAVPGIRVSRSPALRDRTGAIRGYLQYLSFDVPLFFRLLFARGQIVVSEPPPTTGAITAITSWIRRRPFVYYAADIWTDAVASTSAPRVVVRLMRAVEGAVLRRAACILAVSDDVAARTREFGARRVDTVGNGVDTTIFTPDGPVAKHDGTYFVYAGTMSEWQGADVFVEALRAVHVTHHEVEVHVFGQGSRVAELQSLAAQLVPGRVHFHGLVSPHETAAWLRGAVAALVSIVPEQGYDFAKPTKLYAAAACGTPVIFAGGGAARDLVVNKGLGIAADYSTSAVASAMLEELAALETGETAAMRPARVAWARDNASLDAVGMRAAAAVLSVDFTRGE